MADQPTSSRPTAFALIRRWCVALLAAAVTALTLSAAPAFADTVLDVTSTTTRTAEPHSTVALDGVTLLGASDTDTIQVTVSTSSGTVALTRTSGLTPAFGSSFSGQAITVTGTQADLNAALTTLMLTAGNGGRVATITAAALPTTAVSGSVYAFSAPNGHFYEYVSSPGISWTDARTQASWRTFLGQPGYLATITDQQINDLISTRLQGARNVWFGGQSTDTRNQNPARTYTWAGGPLQGQTFTSCSNFISSCVFTQDPSTFTSWASGEPNNFIGYGNGRYVDGERYPVTNWQGTVGRWNDLADSNEYISGYVVEYGDKALGATHFDGLTTASSDVTITTAAPDAPTGVYATPADGSATVYFTAGADNGSPATGYTVTASPGGASATCAASPCTVTGLTNGSDYTFSVVANSALGSSAGAGTSYPVTVRREITAPAAPKLSLTSGDGSITVAITPQDDGGSPIRSYYLYLLDDDENYLFDEYGSYRYLYLDGANLQGTFTGLTNGSSYRVEGYAYNGYYFSAPVRSGTAVPATTPGPVSGVTANVADGGVTVSFAPPATDGGSPVVAYTVTSQPGGAICTTTTTTCTVTGLTPGQSYTFSVAADNTAAGRTGTGTGPAVVSYSVLLAAAPAAPSATVSSDNGAALITVVPGADGGSPITGYEVSLDGGATWGPLALSGDPLQGRVDGLTNGTPYAVQVRATNIEGAGAPTSTTRVVPATTPGPVSGIKTTVAGNDVTVSFTAPASDGGSPVTGYTVTARPGGAVCSTTTTSCVVKGLTPGQTYTFDVVASNAAAGRTGTGAGAPTTSQPVLVPGAPDAPTGVVAQAGDGSAVVAFTKSVEHGSAVTGYTVTSSPGGVKASCPASPCTVSGLTNGTSYTFTVVAASAAGGSAPSAPSAPATPVAASPVLDTTVSVDQKTAASSLTAPAISTRQAGELLVALVSVDGPKNKAQTVKSVTGGGLTWKRVGTAAAKYGTVEVWQAWATAKVSNVKVVATLASTGYDGSMTVAAFTGAAQSVAATAVGTGTTGVATTTLTPTSSGSLVWAVGHYFNTAASVITAQGQVVQHQFVDTRVKDTFWTQRVTAPAKAGMALTVSSTTANTMPWQLLAVEIRGANG